MFDLIKFIEKKKEFSQRVHGPGDRTRGIVDHIRKELVEIENAPRGMVLEEWIDVILLALDQAWRLGYSPEEICAALSFKNAKNMKRKWPDWRNVDLDKALEHEREEAGDQVVEIHRKA